MPRVWLLKRVQLIVQAPELTTFTLRTDLPDEAMLERYSKTFTTLGLTDKQRVVNFDLTNGIRARLVQYEIQSLGVVRLFGGSVYCRALDGGDWQWLALPGLGKQLVDWKDLPLPIGAEPKTWSDLPLPIPPEPKTWSDVDLGIPGAPKSWTDVALPIAPAPATWSDKVLPFRAAPDELSWAELPVDA